jgi:hypothetical protein
MAYVISFFLVCGQLPILVAVGVLLDRFGTVLLPLDWVPDMAILVLSVGIPVRADEPASVISLGLEDFVVPVLVVGFSIGNFHCVG